MRSARSFLAFVALLGLAGRSQADLIVTVEDATITAGSISPLLLDVFISSSNPGGDPLQQFSLTFTISGPTTNLQFESEDPGNSAFLSSSQYVFSGDSADNGDQGTIASPFGTASPGAPPALDSVFNATDSTVDGSAVTVGQGSPGLLLAQLAFNVPAFVVGGSSDVYTVTLNPSTDQQNNPNFLDAFGNTVNFDTKDSKLTGTITVDGVTPVPEPSSAYLALSAAILLGIYACQRSACSAVVHRCDPARVRPQSALNWFVRERSC